MASNYRDSLLSTSATYHASLRDQRIKEIGVKALIKLPKTEENRNLYRDFINEDKDYYNVETYVEPRLTMYFQQLSLLGQSAEDTLPLEIQIMTNDNMPKDSIICLPEKNTDGDIVYRNWRVLETKTKQIGNFYSRIALAVPHRKSDSVILPEEYKPGDYKLDQVAPDFFGTIKFGYKVRTPALIY